jgi:hypothetical protein
MNRQRTNLGNVCSLCGAQQRIFKNCLAKPCAFFIKVHGTWLNHHWHEVLWTAFGRTRCRI